MEFTWDMFVIAGILILAFFVTTYAIARYNVERDHRRRKQIYYRKYTEWKAENRRRELMGKDELPPPAGYPYF